MFQLKNRRNYLKRWCNWTKNQGMTLDWFHVCRIWIGPGPIFLRISIFFWINSTTKQLHITIQIFFITVFDRTKQCLIETWQLSHNSIASWFQLQNNILLWCYVWCHFWISFCYCLLRRFNWCWSGLRPMIGFLEPSRSRWRFQTDIRNSCSTDLEKSKTVELLYIVADAK